MLKEYNEEYCYEIANSGYGKQITVYNKVGEEVTSWYMNDMEDEPDGSRPTIDNALDSWYEERED